MAAPAKKDPWSKFFWADWRSDPCLRMCSLAARGLWVEMLAVMHEADPCGHLLVNGNALTDQQLASMAGASAAEVRKLKAELERAGVPTIVNGIWTSRRMVRDAHRSAVNRQNGKAGGNPALTDKDGEDIRLSESDKRNVSEQDNGSDKSHATRVPDARSQIPEKEPPSPQFEPVAAGDGRGGDFSPEAQEAVSDYERLYGEIFGRDCLTRRLDLWPEAQKWIDEGFTVETLRLAVYDGMIWFRDKGIKPPSSFDKIKSLHPIAERLRAERAKSGALTNFAHPDAGKWPQWAEAYRDRGFWSDGRGEFPGTMPAEWVAFATGKTDARPDARGEAA